MQPISLFMSVKLKLIKNKEIILCTCMGLCKGHPSYPIHLDDNLIVTDGTGVRQVVSEIVFISRLQIQTEIW